MHRRRQAILTTARDLFESQGYEATTMAAIAAAADVSPPTVFNYFGTKDALIAALVLDGHERGRHDLCDWQPEPDWSFAEMLTELMLFYSGATMRVAGKHVWRYAEASNINRTNLQIRELYDRIEANHTNEITSFVQRYAPDLPSEQSAVIAGAAYSHWNWVFLRYIREDDVSYQAHLDEVRREIRALADVFSLALSQRDQ